MSGRLRVSPPMKTSQMWAVARVPFGADLEDVGDDADADAAVTSCKLFMTYTAMQLRDNELLDVMYEARKLAVTTVSGSVPVCLSPMSLTPECPCSDDPRGERRPHSLANGRVFLRD